MNTVFHEGEYHIQDIMGVREKSDTLTAMIKNTIPKIAKTFLENLKFCVIVLSTQDDNLFSSLIYDGQYNFIEIINNKEICIDLNNRTFIPEYFFKKGFLNIGIIGLDLEHALRIRVNGKAKIQNNKLHVFINEIYSNCPRYITKRLLQKELKFLEKETIYKGKELKKDLIRFILNTDIFFIASSHKNRGLDISHKGGEKGFVKVISPTQLQFNDMPGNNLYNTLGNIYTNPYINMFFIDFEKNNTYNILGKAKIEEKILNNKKILSIIVDCIDITINLNSFSLDYR